MLQLFFWVILYIILFYYNKNINYFNADET